MSFSLENKELDSFFLDFVNLLGGRLGHTRKDGNFPDASKLYVFIFSISDERTYLKVSFLFSPNHLKVSFCSFCVFQRQNELFSGS
jgi:hypothetical protein